MVLMSSFHTWDLVSIAMARKTTTKSPTLLSYTVNLSLSDDLARCLSFVGLMDQVGEADGMGISVEVFNQGMAKTELCNKWEEMGWCPYGDQCQFAHGVDELRPVIRHPRYKTQLCRMISGPGGCPYGHRCHFRHAHLHTQNNQ